MGSHSVAKQKLQNKCQIKNQKHESIHEIALLCILISSKSFAVNPDLADGSEDDNLVKTDGKFDYKELMTFTYKELRDEVEKEMEDENEQRYQKALENKRAKLGLKEGDPGYDEVDVDYEKVYYTRLDTDPNYEHFGVEDDYEDYDQSVKETNLIFIQVHLWRDNWQMRNLR